MVDVEKRCLGALEQDVLALLHQVVEQDARLADVGAQALGHRQIGLADLVHRVGGQVEDALELRIHAVKDGGELGAERVLVQQVLHADAHAGHLVLVARSNAALGGADVVLAQQFLVGAVQVDVIRHDHMRVARDLEVGGGDAVTLEHVDFLEEHGGVHHAAVADDRDAVRVHDAGGHLMQAVLLIAHHDGVAGVISTLVADDAVELGSDQVADLALALVAPLGSHQHC